jgi:hypothetical protein
MPSVLKLLLAAAMLLGTAPPLAAQGYPSGANTLVIPLSPGDGADVAGRAMAEKLAKLLQEYAPPEKVLAEIREEHRVQDEVARKAGLVK